MSAYLAEFIGTFLNILLDEMFAVFLFWNIDMIGVLVIVLFVTIFSPILTLHARKVYSKS